MVKQKKSEEPKNSKQIAKPSPKGKIKVTGETVVVLNVTEPGRFSHRESNASSKQICNKLSYKPGKCPMGLTPKGMEYKEPTYYKCSRRVTIGAEAIKYYISDDACALRGKDAMKRWRGMNQYQRLEANLALTADGKPFEYEILN
jgi:hypothetical protein